jgi:acetyltransferase-like isoleucine patch superfamily enzyme
MDFKRLFQELRYILPTLYFNFHYLPFRQAVRLPIVLYKPHLVKCKGRVVLSPVDGRIRHGMVQMGFYITKVYPNSGVMWENNGGTVVFRGSVIMGNDTYLSFGESTTADFGDDFRSSAAMKIVSTKGIAFGAHDRVGWGCLFLDSNMHPLYDMEKKENLPDGGPIAIGEYNWFAADCKIMHSVTTPERCIFGMGTTVTRGCVKKPYCVMGGSPVRVLRENVMRLKY